VLLLSAPRRFPQGARLVARLRIGRFQDASKPSSGITPSRATCRKIFCLESYSHSGASASNFRYSRLAPFPARMAALYPLPRSQIRRAALRRTRRSPAACLRSPVSSSRRMNASFMRTNDAVHTHETHHSRAPLMHSRASGKLTRPQSSSPFTRTNASFTERQTTNLLSAIYRAAFAKPRQNQNTCGFPRERGGAELRARHYHGPGCRRRPRRQIDALRDKIRHHEHLYFILDQPSISDAEFERPRARAQAPRSRPP